jgi:hypothetical protein
VRELIDRAERFSPSREGISDFAHRDMFPRTPYWPSDPWFVGIPTESGKKQRYFVLRGYIDDSGRKDHSPVMVLGGWIASVPTWLLFTSDWQAMLDMPPRIEYFKMNEAATLTEQFRDWSRERADERIALAYKTIEEHIPYQVSCIIHLEPYYRIFTPDIMEGSAINPFYLAFGSIIKDVAYHQRTHGIDEKIDFVFDEQVTEKGKIIDAWDFLKVRVRPEDQHLIGSVPAFLDDKKFLR